MEQKATVDLDELHLRRKAIGMSISDMAERLGYKTPTGYWLIERGERKVSIDTLYKLSKLYGCAMEDLIKLV